MDQGDGTAVSGNVWAPAGTVWRCRVCGKRSRDLSGSEPLDRGYDASCMLNAELAPASAEVDRADES